MSVKFIFLVPLFVVFANKIYAQTAAGKISGTVRDFQNKPLSGTTVTLHGFPDTTKTATRIADQTGGFVFKNIVKGSYVITCTAISFRAYATGRLIIDDAHG